MKNGSGWIVGQHGTVLYSTDNGESWQLIQTGMPADYMHVSFVNSDSGWAVAKTRDSSYVAVSHDGGESWAYLSSLGVTEIPDMQFTSSERGYIAANIPDGGYFLEIRKTA
ncbi:MAG: hypothetical protein IPP40_11935 [bacterium]|nr:hypothetical protein [bacterium]